MSKKQICCICGRECETSSLRRDKDIGSGNCEVCGKFFCSNCIEEHTISIPITGCSNICFDCVTPKLEKLMDKVSNAEDRYIRAKDNWCHACDKLLNALDKAKKII